MGKKSYPNNKLNARRVIERYHTRNYSWPYYPYAFPNMV